MSPPLVIPLQSFAFFLRFSFYLRHFSGRVLLKSPLPRNVPGFHKRLHGQIHHLLTTVTPGEVSYLLICVSFILKFTSSL